MNADPVESRPPHETRPDTAFALGVAVLFACICGIAISYHEMWRDELQAWLIARSADSLAELRDAMRYEGHPALWYLLLYAVTRASQRPEAMQALHVGIGTVCAFLFARSAPFPRWARLCFVLGYFPLYEYGVISRNYSIGILFLFAAAALLPQRSRRPWLLGLLLALAANTSAMALIVAAAFASTVFLEPLLAHGGRAARGAAAKTLAVTAAGILLAATYTTVPAGAGGAESWALSVDRLWAERTVGLFARALVPIPTERGGAGSMWNWTATLSHHVPPLVAILLMGCLLPWLLRRRVALVMFAVGTSALLLFFYTQLSGSIRHHGFLFINLVLAAWYAEVVRQESAAAPALAEAAGGAERIFPLLASLLLVTHLAFAVSAVRTDIASVFSAGRATARLLVANDLDELPIVADPDTLMASVLGYLPQRTVYYPRSGRFGSFTRHDQGRIDAELSDEELLAAARKLERESGQAVAIVVARRLSAVLAGYAEEVGCASAALVPAESYCVYRLRPQAAPRAPS